VCRSLLPCCIFVISCHIVVVVGGYCRRSLLLFEFSYKPTVAVAHTSTNAFDIVSLSRMAIVSSSCRSLLVGRSFCPAIPVVRTARRPRVHCEPCTSLFSQTLHCHIPTKPYIFIIYSNIKPYSHLGHHIFEYSCRHIASRHHLSELPTSSLPTWVSLQVC